MADTIILQAENIYKSFGPTKAVVDFSFSVAAGEIRGLIGENGSGKSTLTSIIAGIQPADSGKFTLLGKDYMPKSPVDANEKGVAMIMQEIGTIADTTVADNIFAGKENNFARFGIINYKKMHEQARAILSKVGADYISTTAKASTLSLEARKVVEIAKAVNDKTRLLIVDETSNALTKSGRDILYKAIRDLKASGGSVIFITHDLNELIEICDSVTIMRDGVYVDTLRHEEMDLHRLKILMVGREMAQNFYRSDYEASHGDKLVLSAKNISSLALNDVSFDVYSGEILGIGGLADCGMHELGRTLFGLNEFAKGEISVGGNKISSPAQAIKNSIGYISKNRDTEALVLQMSIRDNICIASLKKLAKAGIITKSKEKKFVTELSDKLQIKMNGINQYAAFLSGGNKQKVVLAKWLGNGSKILVMDCPTRGIDIGVKEAIYKLMMELKAQGHSLIMISEELPELIGMSDRMLIMKDGKIKSEYQRSEEITEKLLIKDMI